MLRRASVLFGEVLNLLEAGDDPLLARRPAARLLDLRLDAQLGKEGRLVAALHELYRVQARLRPDFLDELRRNGRGAEIPETPATDA